MNLLRRFAMQFSCQSFNPSNLFRILLLSLTGNNPKIKQVSIFSQEPRSVWIAATAPPEEAVVAPQPAGRHAVDQAVEEREQDVEGEVGPLGDGARHDGGAGSGV